MMSTNEHPASLARTRGRPRSFDTDVAITEAMELFWARGYASTSLDDLVGALGINVSSLYAAFESKRQLFLAAIARYEATMGPQFDALAADTRGIEGIVDFLERMRERVRDASAPAGCLIVNSGLEGGATDDRIADATRRYRQRVYAALLSALKTAEANGQIAPRTATGRARTLLAMLFGAFAIARSGDTEEAALALSAATGEVRRWRLAR